MITPMNFWTMNVARRSHVPVQCWQITLLANMIGRALGFLTLVMMTDTVTTSCSWFLLLVQPYHTAGVMSTPAARVFQAQGQLLG